MKTAVDTNILVRFFTEDDGRQAAASRRIFEHERILLVPTVILETEWVLRSVYRFDREMIDGVFSTLLARPNVEIVGEAKLIVALDLLRKGMDFADALHLAHASDADEFVTFDRDLARRAEPEINAVPVRLL